MKHQMRKTKLTVTKKRFNIKKFIYIFLKKMKRPKGKKTKVHNMHIGRRLKSLYRRDLRH